MLKNGGLSSFVEERPLAQKNVRTIVSTGRSQFAEFHFDVFRVL
jgi:hypothetical protein